MQKKLFKFLDNQNAIQEALNETQRAGIAEEEEQTYSQSS